MPGSHRAPRASPAAQASRARRAGGSPGTATMSHRDGQDRHDVTSWRLGRRHRRRRSAAGGAAGARAAGGVGGREGAPEPPPGRPGLRSSLQKSHTHAASTPSHRRQVSADANRRSREPGRTQEPQERSPGRRRERSCPANLANWRRAAALRLRLGGCGSPRGDAWLRVAPRAGIQRDRAERESAQIRTVFSGGLAPACRRLDGQDSQRPVDHPVLCGPSAQRLDDVGDMICAGVCPLVGLPRPRAVQLDLEARHVQALGIRVACLRRRPVVRRSHASPGSPGAPQSNDAVI